MKECEGIFTEKLHLTFWEKQKNSVWPDLGDVWMFMWA